MATSSSSPNRYVSAPAPSGLADVLDLILDKGLVIDVYVRVSLVGIELLTIDARIVVASVDTYLRFAEAVGRLNIDDDEKEGLPELMHDMTSGAASSKTKGALEGAKDKFSEIFESDEEDEDVEDAEEVEEVEEEPEKEPARPRRRREQSK
jgi:nucleosome binding factor SPN SPT16 subunit